MVSDWERGLREEASSKRHDVRIFAREHFPVLAAALELSPGERLESRVLASVAAFDRDASDAPQWDEFRALLWAACAWWGISELRPTREQWAAYTKTAGLADEHEYARDVDRRSFRHAWAAHEYRGRRQGLSEPFPLGAADYENGRRNPLKAQVQDALIAFLLALTHDGDGAEFWDSRTNRLVRAGVPVAPDDGAAVQRPTHHEDSTPPAVQAFYERVRRLGQRIVPALLTEAEDIASELEMPPPASWAEFGRRLVVLVRIRGVLERLTPAVFEASLSDLMTLISPMDGGEFAASHARHARRLSERYVRPWVTLTPVQLSNSATMAMQTRQEWRQLTGQTPPAVVPMRLEETQLAWAVAGVQLEEIDRILDLQGDDRLAERSVGDLRAALDRIGAIRSEPSALKSDRMRSDEQP
ncbi:hypothetical protein ET445_13885 [Agromyces protaetiae]|uniref:Uncharacterized protein n=1 Tax=Agromyces protaetiae TaxID=2509455 RepID=A0A4P6FGJ9_9MICO|nr:hypothetical protein [Agromyces protaetiae]QAY74253.1 hypothetical protein ET445_13885 [Agromyces protaetiae]